MKERQRHILVIKFCFRIVIVQGPLITNLIINRYGDKLANQRIIKDILKNLLVQLFQCSQCGFELTLIDSRLFFLFIIGLVDQLQLTFYRSCIDFNLHQRCPQNTCPSPFIDKNSQMHSGIYMQLNMTQSRSVLPDVRTVGLLA